MGGDGLHWVGRAGSGEGQRPGRQGQDNPRHLVCLSSDAQLATGFSAAKPLASFQLDHAQMLDDFFRLVPLAGRGMR